MEEKIKILKEKAHSVVSKSINKYKYDNYSPQARIYEIECSIALHMVDELYGMSTVDKYDKCDIIIKDIIIGIKTIFNFLSKNKKIEILDVYELIDIIYNLICEIIDNSIELLESVL